MELFDLIKSIRIRDDIPMLVNYLELTGVGVEIGTQLGLYAQVILGGTFLDKLVLVDCWDLVQTPSQNDSGITLEQNREVEKKVRDRFQHHIESGKVKIEKGFSVEVAERFEDDTLDFIYIDGDHSENAVFDDLNAWYPKLNSGGLMAGHDYINNTPWVPIKFGVIEAVSRFRVELPDHEFFLTEDDHIPSWILIKP